MLLIISLIFSNRGSVDLLREIEDNLHALVLYIHKMGPGDQTQALDLVASNFTWWTTLAKLIAKIYIYLFCLVKCEHIHATVYIWELENMF